MRAARRSQVDDERGVAMVMVVLLLLIVGGITAVITITTRSTVNRAHERSDRVLARTAVDAGLEAYLQALNGDIAGEHTGFYLCQSAIDDLVADMPGATRIANGSLPATMANLRLVDNGPLYGLQNAPCNALHTVRQSNPDVPNLYQFWQMYSLARPTYTWNSSGRVVAYIRGWTATGDGTIVTQPRLLRVELRPGRFADYQVIADGPIVIGEGATINGRVHSNGFKDMLFGMTPGSGQISVESTATCTPSARFSATRSTIGPISLSGSGCNASMASDDTGEPVSVLRASDHVFNRIRPKCGLANAYMRIRCFRWNQANNNGTGGDRSDDYFQVSLSGSIATVTGNSTWTETVASPAPQRRGNVLLFEKNVRLSGMVSGSRLNIATYLDDQNLNSLRGENSGNSITIVGDTGTSVVPENVDKFDVAGLMAQGDVVLDIDNTCPGVLNAAMIAEAGALTIPNDWRTPQQLPGTNPPLCPGLSLTGAMAGHYSPIMLITYWCDPCFGSPARAGYATRDYTWDAHLYDNPPPYFPTTGPWQMWSYKDANYDCYNNTVVPPRLLRPECE